MSMSNSFLILPLLSSWRNFLSEDFFFLVLISRGSLLFCYFISSLFSSQRHQDFAIVEWVLLLIEFCVPKPVSLLSDLFHVAFSKMSLLIDDFLGKLTYLNVHSASNLLMCMKVNNGWSVKYEKGVEAFTELL